VRWPATRTGATAAASFLLVGDYLTSYGLDRCCDKLARFGHVMGQPDCPGETSRDAGAVLGKARVTGPSPA
jgi:hypothetical protein